MAHMATKQQTPHNHDCTTMILPVRDALDVLSGKWKLPIRRNKQFKQIARDIPKITD